MVPFCFSPFLGEFPPTWRCQDKDQEGMSSCLPPHPSPGGGSAASATVRNTGVEHLLPVDLSATTNITTGTLSHQHIGRRTDRIGGFILIQMIVHHVQFDNGLISTWIQLAAAVFVELPDVPWGVFANISNFRKVWKNISRNISQNRNSPELLILAGIETDSRFPDEICENKNAQKEKHFFYFSDPEGQQKW